MGSRDRLIAALSKSLMVFESQLERVADDIESLQGAGDAFTDAIWTGPDQALTSPPSEHAERIRQVLAEVTSAAEAMLARLGEPVRSEPHPTSLAARGRLVIPEGMEAREDGEWGGMKLLRLEKTPPPEDQLSYQLPLEELTEQNAVFKYRGVGGEPDIAVWVPRPHWEGHFRRTGFLRADCTRVTDQ